MAHYETSVTTHHSPAEAFAMMADMTRFADWDPGVQSATQTSGTEPGLGAAYRLVVNGVGPAPATTLTYEVNEYEPDRRYRAVAKARFFSSDDIVTVTAEGQGSTVKYEADLYLNGPLKVLDPLLGPIFNKIGDAAAEGLKDFLG
ncbi:MAG: SRPBCC family protein [Acidimicrobiia bacterium]